MKPSHKAIAGIFSAAALLSGGTIAQVRSDSLPLYDRYTRAALGVVDSVEVVRGSNEGSSVAGTILGGVIGGVLGHQIGSGRGNDAATVAGAIGGAVVGHEIGESKGGRDAYRIRVRLDSGEFQSIQQDNVNGLRVGDRVKVEGDRIVLFAASGDRYDNQGYRIDDRGYRYDAQGYRIDDRGYRYDAQGYRIDDRGYRYDAQGYRIDDRGNRYDPEGYRVDDRGIRF